MKNRRESKRPGTTVQWNINSPLVIIIQDDDKIEYTTVNYRGNTLFRSGEVGRNATIILGHREGTKIYLTSNDDVFTAKFGAHGHLSSLPPGYSGKEATIIIHRRSLIDGDKHGN